MLGSVTSDDILIIHNANPVYSMPGAAEHIRRAGTVVYLGTYRDETAELATWVLPIDSPFESWGDYEPWTGVHGLIQPVTPRLHDTRAIGDILLALAEVGGQSLSSDGTFEEWLRNRWDGLRKETAASAPSADFWTESLRAGGRWAERPAVSVSLGHGCRPAALYRLRGVHGGLLCRKQYSRHGQGADRQKPANGMA